MPEKGTYKGVRPGAQEGAQGGTSKGAAAGALNGSSSLVYQPETIAWVNQLTSLPSSRPSAAYLFEIDTLITNLKNASIWYQLDRFWIFATEQQAHARVSLVNPNGIKTTWPSNITENGSPTWTKLQGYTGNGSSMYLNTNYVSKNSKLVTPTNISWMTYCRTTVNDGSAVEFGNNVSGVDFTVGRLFTGTAATLGINCSSGSNYTTSSGKGLWSVARVNGSQVSISRNGNSSIFSQTNLGDSSGGTDNQAMYVLAWNRFSGNTAGDFSSQQLSMFAAGTGNINQSLFYTYFQEFAQKIGFNV